MAHKKIVVVGAGGHAKVLADLIDADGRFRVAGATDSNPHGDAAKLSGLKILGTDKVLPRLKSEGVRRAAVGVGASPHTAPRAALRRELLRLGFKLPALVHPRAIVSPLAELGDGAQVMAGAIVNAGARLGAGSVVNTGAIVEHDCAIGADAFVAPGAVLGGQVRLGAGAFVGLGAVVNPGLKIGTRAIVGSGAVVVKDVRAGATVVGVPARETKRRA
jgi:UDP-perosamine 4-acetyltransferase